MKKFARITALLKFIVYMRVETHQTISTETLPSPYALKQEFRLSSQQALFIQESRQQIERILSGYDQRLLLIVGPCSIHDSVSAKEYARRLKALAEQVSDSFFIVMRTYFEKPRTSLGWKGLIYDPELNGSNNIALGLRQARDLLLQLTDMQVPAGTEFLDPLTPRFLEDLISWSCIGARTSESQIHRQFASGLAMPVAFKNNTSGNIEVAINGVLSASSPHTFFGIDEMGHVAMIRTKGNAHAHIALRGSEHKPNYDERSIAGVLERIRKANMPPRIIVDCSHDNSSRNHEEQPTVFESVLKQYLKGNVAIKGLAFESHLNAGNQKMVMDKSKLHYAVSLTDPCLDWENTESLIRWGAEMVASQRSPSAAACMQ